MKLINHYRMIKKHRKEVRRLCFKCGLYWQGIIHDLSKYSYIEFSEGVKYFDGKKSPTAVCRKLTGKSDAWEHHKKKNKHHPEYWINNKEYKLMPYKYAVELSLKRNEKIDDVEKDINYLKKSERAYLELSNLYNYEKIECVDNEIILTPLEIHKKIINIIEKNEDV